VSIDIKYPGAIIRPSIISHDRRPVTFGVCWHWSVGHEAGDTFVLSGHTQPRVDSFGYTAKDGDFYQFLDPRDASWTAMHTANFNSVHVETEGSGEGWTDAQLERNLEVADWLSDLFQIPRRHVNPPTDWAGHYGHADLSDAPAIDGNSHTDTVPAPPGWPVFIDRLQALTRPIPPAPPPLPFDGALRLVLNGTLFAGWENAAGPITWIARHGLAPDAQVAISFRGPNADKAAVWRGPDKVTGVCRNLDARFLSPRRKAA
jgi:hypothetical protein